MQKNDLFEVEITDMGVDGEGIGKYGGMTFFIKDACIGDVIRARVMKLKKNYGYARVEEVLTPSTFRIVPKCPIYRQCGGCQIQQMAYDAQLAFKNRKVKNNLMRLGGFSEKEIDRIMLPVVGMETPYRYRNKAQFPVGYDKNGNIVFGFYASHSHNIIPVEDCYLGVEQNQQILSLVREWMMAYGIKPYDENNRTGLLRHVLIRFGFTTKEIMVCLIIHGKKLPFGHELADMLAPIAGMTSISYNINMEHTNRILGDRTVCIWGKPYITDYIHLKKCSDFSEDMACALQGEGTDCGHAIEAMPGDSSANETRESVQTYCKAYEDVDTAIGYQISPQSFYQVNPVQTEKLYSTALEFAGLTGNETVWDLYCGIGTISLFLSQKAKKVYGVEIVPQAIEDAERNAKMNGITNAEFFVGKAEEVLPKFYEQAGKKDETDMLHPDVIVVDPPRKGCDAMCLTTMLQMRPERIVYVSCDSATLARDLRILCDGGYELKKVQAVDQFGNTTHVETVCLLSKKAQ